jgi:hypothetical protein
VDSCAIADADKPKHEAPEITSAAVICLNDLRTEKRLAECMSSLLFTLFYPAFRYIRRRAEKVRRQRTRARLVNLLIPHHTPYLVNQFCGFFCFDDRIVWF